MQAGRTRNWQNEKNIELVTTNLTGRETEDILGDFEYSGEGKKVDRRKDRSR